MRIKQFGVLKTMINPNFDPMGVPRTQKLRHFYIFFSLLISLVFLTPRHFGHFSNNPILCKQYVIDYGHFMNNGFVEFKSY